MFIASGFCFRHCPGIREVLREKSKCPKCSSDKFKAEDLLPNLSLREAIVHFLETQIQFSISETALRRYVPGRNHITNQFPSISPSIKLEVRDSGGSYFSETSR